MKNKTLDTKGFWERIKKDYNLDNFLFLFGWMIICLFFSKPINNLANTIGDNLFQYDQSGLYDVLAFVLLIAFGIIRWLIPIYKTCHKDWILLFFIGFLIWYIPARIGIEPKVNFVPFSFCNQFKLLDLLGIAFVLEIFQIRKYKKLRLSELKEFRQALNRRKGQAKQSSFITDEAYLPKSTEHKDLLGFDSFAERIAAEAKNISSSESVVFGINGEWGEGKTSMINLIRQKLETEKYTVVDFHPWKTNSGKAVTQLFFDVLKDGLKGKIIGINWKIDRYAEALLHLDKTGFGKMLWQLFASSDSVEEQKKKLGESMKMLDKNLIVIVDDLDRLAKNEIADVLKLMRDTANFPNLVFLAAYDRKYLDAAIKSEINDHKPENYMDKIVLWEAPIYRPQPRKYLEVLKNLLKEKLPQFEQKIDEVFGIEQEQTLKLIHTTTRRKTKERNGIKMFDTLYDIHSTIFTDLRKTKRFINILTFDIKIVQDKIEFHDFYYLTLLRFCNTQYYNAFKKCFHYLYGAENNSHIPGIIDREEKHYREQFAIEFSINEDSIERLPFAIVSELLSKSMHYAPSSIYFYKNFPIYFHLGNANDITMSDFTEMLNANDFETFKNRVDELLKIGNIIEQFDINSIITALRDSLNIGDTKSYIEYFERMIWMAIKYDHREFHNECHSRMQQICRNKDYKIDVKQVQTELIDFVLKESIQREVQYYFYRVIENAFNSKTVALNESYFEIKAAIKYSRQNFKSKIKSTDAITPEIINLFYCSYRNTTKKDGNTINQMRDLANKYPDDFVKFIVVLYSRTPVTTEPETIYDYQFVDFLVDIFKSSSDFINFLKTSQFKSELRRANLYRKYAEKFNSKNPNAPIHGIFTPTRNEYINLLAGLDPLDVLLDWKLRARIDESMNSRIKTN